MKMAAKKARIWAPLICAWLYSSCAAPPASRKPAFESSLQRGQQYYAAGKFQGAIDSYQAALRQFPDEKAVLNEYLKTLEGIWKHADRSFAAEDFAAAEMIYVLLVKNSAKFSRFSGSLPFSPQILVQKIQECRLSLFKRQAQQALQTADFQKVLDSYKVAPPGGAVDRASAAGYLKIVEEIKRLADEAAAKEDYIKAGIGYAVLRKEYPAAEKLGQALSFSGNSLDEGLKKCRAQLTQKGLEQYRQGKLQEAVSLWQGLLQFDPENDEIKRAVDTATEQRKKLKKE
jgi:tetratricopeptide (TPR) repeat protein